MHAAMCSLAAEASNAAAFPNASVKKYARNQLKNSKSVQETTICCTLPMRAISEQMKQKMLITCSNTQ